MPLGQAMNEGFWVDKGQIFHFQRDKKFSQRFSVRNRVIKVNVEESCYFYGQGAINRGLQERATGGNDERFE